jgi:lysozyme
MAYAYSYSRNGLSLTEGFEGCRLTAYLDDGGIPTIGYGHTGPDVYLGLVITQAQAEQFLLGDVKRAEACVNTHVTMPGLNQDEFDALVDFTFNAGVGAFVGSTLLKDLNAGKIAEAEAQFEVWDHVSGKVVAGLLRRRLAEEKLFEDGVAA